LDYSDAYAYEGDAEDAPPSNILLHNYIHLAYQYADKLAADGVSGDRIRVVRKLFTRLLKICGIGLRAPSRAPIVRSSQMFMKIFSGRAKRRRRSTTDILHI
jgi:hypothetical protein